MQNTQKQVQDRLKPCVVDNKNGGKEEGDAILEQPLTDDADTVSS